MVSRLISAADGRRPSASWLKYARELFRIADQPSFTMPSRHWDVLDWYANIEKSQGPDKLGEAPDFNRWPEANR